MRRNVQYVLQLLILIQSQCATGDRERVLNLVTECRFVFLQEKLECSLKRDIEGMGVAEIKYGDSLCFLMHVATGLWLSFQAPDVKSARLGPLKRRVRSSRVFLM